MRVSAIAKLFVTVFFVGFLAACGGGGSSSGCLPTDPGCNETPETIDALGADGPLANAPVRLLRLSEFLTTTGDSIVGEVSSGADGLVNDLVLDLNAGSGPFVLQFISDASTIDLTTGAAPVIDQVLTLISAADFAQQPRPRFYATAFTTLAFELARTFSVANGSSVEDELGNASQAVLQSFGFGMDVSTSLFGPNAVPPVLDENTVTLADQQAVIEYRVALESFAEMVEQVEAGGSAGSVEQVTGEILAVLGRGESLGDPSDGTPTLAGSIEEAIVAQINGVTENYLDGRLSIDSNPPGSTPSTTDVQEAIQALVNGELDDVSAPLAGTIGVVPEVSDFDGDGVDNLTDVNPYDGAISIDADSDGIDDSGDNCVLGANDDLGNPISQMRADNFNQTNTDGDLFGDLCDNDADGDGVNGDGSGGTGADVNDLNNTLIVDIDNDEIDDDGGPAPISGPDNCLPGKVLFSGLPEQFTLTVMQAANMDQLDLDGDGEGNACDEDADGDTASGDGLGGEGETLFGIGVGDPNDLDDTISPTDADADAVPNSTDNCPLTPNGPIGDEDGQDISGSSIFGDLCDTDDDGRPDVNQDIAGIVDIGDGIPVDNCPDISNSPFLDNDNDDEGDLCDSDDDNDEIPDLRDPAPFNSVSTYNFDSFYVQQSDDGAGTGFKLATISESVLFDTGSIVAVVGTNNLLEVGPDGVNPDTYIVDGDYQTVENSIVFAGAGFAAASPGSTSVNNNRVSVTSPSLSSAATYAEPNLTLEGAALSPWGNSSFVGAGTNGVGRPDLGVVGDGVLAGARAEQGLTVLSYVDAGGSAPDSSVLDGVYGFVDLTVDYDGAMTTTNLVTVQSRAYDMTFDALNGVSANGVMSQYDVSVGTGNGVVTFDTNALAETGYSVANSGAVVLTTTGLQGIVDTEGNLVTVSADNMRGYAVKLDAAATAAQIVAQGPYRLEGLVVQPNVDKLLAYTLEGAMITFTDTGTTDPMTSDPILTANLSYSGDRDSSVFDAGDTTLPTIGTTFSPVNTGVSEPFTMSANGRIARIEFGLGSGQKPAEIEGFFVPGKGLLLRYVETNFVESGLSSSSIELFCGNVPDDLDSLGNPPFIDITSGSPVVPQPTSGYHCGFIELGTAGTLAKISVTARANPGVAQDFNTLVGGDGLSDDGFGQGIVWGIPQSP